jgi:hypothetical protein
MAKVFGVAIALLLSGCAGYSRGPAAASPCAVSEASYECQVQRYHNVNI